jgi:hypothetical protein
LERSSGVTRRDLLRLSMGGGAGLALGGLVDWRRRLRRER